MKKVIFDYLKNYYNINIGQLLLSGLKNGFIEIIESKDIYGNCLPFVYITQKDDKETDFYLFCIGDDSYQDKIQHLIKELKLLIGNNSDNNITRSSYDKDWYHWQDDNMKISFGIRSEKTGFSMRLSFPNTSSTNDSFIPITVQSQKVMD